MKKCIFLIALLFATTAAAQGQAAPDAPHLTKLLNDFLSATGDAAVHDRFWAEDLIYTRASGERTNKAEILKSLRSSPAAKPGDPITVYSGEDVQIRQYGTTAIVAFRLVGRTKDKDANVRTQEFFNTGTFIKRKGKWQAVAWQATAIPQK
ncbi:hypothetical protein BH24ACI3_BH24ACI3_01520 [soil metagenome]